MLNQSPTSPKSCPIPWAVQRDTRLKRNEKQFCLEPYKSTKGKKALKACLVNPRTAVQSGNFTTCNVDMLPSVMMTFQ